MTMLYKIHKGIAFEGPHVDLFVQCGNLTLKHRVLEEVPIHHLSFGGK
jgi:hypothetical protein